MFFRQTYEEYWSVIFIEKSKTGGLFAGGTNLILIENICTFAEKYLKVIEIFTKT